jgi:outer membrane protein, multidrug efflux system
MRRFGGMRRLGLSALAAPLLLGACNLAPEYAPPVVELPMAFKEGGAWERARPSDDLPRGPWWKCFNDRALNELAPQVDAANPDLAAAIASLDEARAYVAKAQSALLPTLNLNNSYSSNKQSYHRPRRKANTVANPDNLIQAAIDGRPLNEPDHYGDNLLTLQSSYEVDLWGRIRNSVAAGEANAESSGAELESVRLSLQAELARVYFGLRGLDAESALLTDTVENYRLALVLTQTRFEGKIGPPEDVARAQAQLETARAQLFELQARRALLEHAIATLIGKPASSFALPPAPVLGRIPLVPAGAPASLLERRPDIAAEERQVAAANASIGVARAAFFPRLMINLTGGTEDTGLSLLNFRNSVWSVGPAVTLPLFDAGLRRAELSRVEAVYLETVAHYRGAVLRAIQEVEDDLSTLRLSAKEAHSLETASAAAQKVLSIALALYRDGATNYLDVVVAQTAALEAQRAVLAIKAQRLQASVALILALGGGWSVAETALADPAPAKTGRPANHD